jgi:hypothetical protein
VCVGKGWGRGVGPRLHAPKPPHKHAVSGSDSGSQMVTRPGQAIQPLPGGHEKAPPLASGARGGAVSVWQGVCEYDDAGEDEEAGGGDPHEGLMTR